MKRGLLLMAVSFFAMTSVFASLKDAYQITATSGTAKAGRQVTLTLNMKNKEAISTWQCDLALPAGVKFISAAVSGTRCGAEYATITSTTKEDGSITLACAPTGDATISGTDGEIATVTLYIERATAVGQVSVKCNNIVLMEANDTPHTYATTEYLMTIAAQDYVYGDLTGDGIVDGADVAALVNVVLGTPTDGTNTDAADMDESGIVDGSDVVTLVNLVVNGN